LNNILKDEDEEEKNTYLQENILPIINEFKEKFEKNCLSKVSISHLETISIIECKSLSSNILNEIKELLKLQDLKNAGIKQFIEKKVLEKFKLFEVSVNVESILNQKNDQIQLKLSSLIFSLSKGLDELKLENPNASIKVIIQEVKENYNMLVDQMKNSLKGLKFNETKNILEKSEKLFSVLEIFEEKVVNYKENENFFKSECESIKKEIEILDFKKTDFAGHNEAEKEFKLISSKLKFLFEVSESKKKEITELIKKNVENIIEETKCLLEEESKDYKSIKRNHQNLKLISEFLSPLVGIKVEPDFVETKIKNLIDINDKEFEKLDVQNIETISNALTKTETIIENFPDIEKYGSLKINGWLKKAEGNKDADYIKLLFCSLRDDKIGKGIPQKILSKYSVFKEQSIFEMGQTFHRNGIKEILLMKDKVYVNENGEEGYKGKTGFTTEKELNSFRSTIDLDLVLLESKYFEFEKLYKLIIDTELAKGKGKRKVDITQTVTNLKLLLGKTPTWTLALQEKIPKIVAHLFAIWTLSNTDGYYKHINDLKNRHFYLKVPHAAQVLAIFRIFGLGREESILKYGKKFFDWLGIENLHDLNNNLVEILTGQGKSVIMAVTCAIFALIGFKVYAACYSKYLSERDWESFEGFFKAISVEKNIEYGTFNSLCETILKENGDVRDILQKFISDGVLSNKKLKRKEKRVLFIDEVDVFFNKDFYGRLFTPSFTLKDPTIKALVSDIWQFQKKEISLNEYTQILNSESFKKCIEKFKDWKDLIEEQVKEMMVDLMNFESKQYKVKNGRIAYKILDRFETNIKFGYLTMWSYFHEHTKGFIPQNIFESEIGILINCHSYSYAEIPKKFDYIMGVTGSLKSLSGGELNQIEKFGIKERTYIPSVYGSNALIFGNDIQVVTKEEFYLAIAKEISTKIKKGGVDCRSVLVFFRDEDSLKEFYNSKDFNYKNECVRIVESLNDKERESAIEKSTRSGQVALVTSAFARGTDFISRDPVVKENGGVHVISTYFPSSSSEEVQIKGRTARQDQKGSFSYVLEVSEFERFGKRDFDLKNLDREKTLNDLTKLRDDKFDVEYKEIQNFVDSSKLEHDKAELLLKNLFQGEKDLVKKELKILNKGPSIAKKSKTICLMDATVSMGELLLKAKNTVAEMFRRAKIILKENGKSEDAFQIQFVVYRNYCCSENFILENSSWTSKAIELIKFMQDINPRGGWGNEAIEIGFYHVNEELKKNEIDQILLIGDAAPNTKDDVKYKRGSSLKKWDNSKYPNTYWEDELKNIISKKVVVNSFYLNSNAKSDFDEISKRTGGSSVPLDVNGDKGAGILTDIVTKKILQSVDPSGDLVKAYEKKPTWQ